MINPKSGQLCQRGELEFRSKIPDSGEATVFVDGLAGVGASDVVVVNALGSLPALVHVRGYVSEAGSVAVVLSGKPGQPVSTKVRFLVIPWW